MLRHRKFGQSFVEYMALILFISIVFLVFQKYIARGFSGRWKTVGESLGQGRIYDPNRTMECIFDPQYTNLWYDSDCFERSSCDCLTAQATPATCRDCIQRCADPKCQ